MTTFKSKAVSKKRKLIDYELLSNKQKETCTSFEFRDFCAFNCESPIEKNKTKKTKVKPCDFSTPIDTVLNCLKSNNARPSSICSKDVACVSVCSHQNKNEFKDVNKNESKKSIELSQWISNHSIYNSLYFKPNQSFFVFKKKWNTLIEQSNTENFGTQPQTQDHILCVLSYLFHVLASIKIYESEQIKQIEGDIQTIKSKHQNVFNNPRKSLLVFYTLATAYENYSPENYLNEKRFSSLLFTEKHNFVFSKLIDQFYDAFNGKVYESSEDVNDDLKIVIEHFGGRLYENHLQRIMFLFGKRETNLLSGYVSYLDTYNGNNSYFDKFSTVSYQHLILRENIVNACKIMCSPCDYRSSFISTQHLQVVANNVSMYLLFDTCCEQKHKRLSIIIDHFEKLFNCALTNIEESKMNEACCILMNFCKNIVQSKGYSKKFCLKKCDNLIWFILNESILKYEKNNQKYLKFCLILVKMLFEVGEKSIAVNIENKENILSWFKDKSNSVLETEKDIKNVYKNFIQTLPKKIFELSNIKQKNLVYLWFIMKDRKWCSLWIESNYPGWTNIEKISSIEISEIMNNRDDSIDLKTLKRAVKLDYHMSK